MKTEDENKEIDINEVPISIDVDSDSGVLLSEEKCEELDELWDNE